MPASTFRAVQHDKELRNPIALPNFCVPHQCNESFFWNQLEGKNGPCGYVDISLPLACLIQISAWHNMSLSPTYPQNRPFFGTYPRLYPQTYPQGLLHPAPLEIQYLLCKGRTFGTYSSVAIKDLTQVDERVIIALRKIQGSSWPPTVSISYIDSNHWLGAA